MKHPQLPADKRTILGKKVKKLRREGFVPANLYGKDIKSTAIQIRADDLKLLRQSGGDSGVIDLLVKKETFPVLMKNLFFNYEDGQVLHVDFHKVNLKEKVKAVLPLRLLGEPQAVTSKLGTLLHTLSEVEVEALPEDLPEALEINIEHLAAVDDHLTVADLKAPKGVAILTDPSQTVVKIAELVAPEPEPEPEEQKEEETAEEAQTGEANLEAEEENPSK